MSEADYLDRDVNAALTDIYEYLIGKSWDSSETFDLYQEAWEKVASAFKVERFDYPAGERPKNRLYKEYENVGKTERTV